MSKELKAKNIWKMSHNRIFKAKTRDSVNFYYNQENNRAIFKGSVDEKWNGQISLSFYVQTEIKFETEHEACIWLLARDKKELK